MCVICVSLYQPNFIIYKAYVSEEVLSKKSNSNKNMFIKISSVLTDMCFIFLEGIDLDMGLCRLCSLRQNLYYMHALNIMK